MIVEEKQLHFKKQNFHGRDFLTLADYTQDELCYLLDLADYIKMQRQRRIVFEPLKGKTLGMIFEKSSTRTRVSFEAGIYQLGGTGIFLSTKDIQMGMGETIADTARVLSGYLDGIMIRTFSQSVVEELAEYSSIPVINGLTDMYHPCQVLADLQTIKEIKGALEGIKLVYIGDGNNMAHSLMIGAAIMGMELIVVSPEGYKPKEEIVIKSQQLAEKHGAKINVEKEPEAAAVDADIIYTDVWVSMGQEDEQAERERAFREYQVNSKLISLAKPDVSFMHCLPARRGKEVTMGVIDGKNSVVFQQSENRLHVQKALMTALMGEIKG